MLNLSDRNGHHRLISTQNKRLVFGIWAIFDHNSPKIWRKWLKKPRIRNFGPRIKRFRSQKINRELRDPRIRIPAN